MGTIKFPTRYVPRSLTRKDRKKQIGMLLKSRRMYKKHQYYTRKQLASYTNKNNKNTNKNNKKSNHIMNARRM